MKRNQYLLVITVAASLVACAADDPYRRTKTGAAVGAVVGGVVGHQVDHSAGKFVGAAVGALAGAAVGHYMDKQEQAFRRELEEEQRQNALEIERLKDDTLKLSLSNEVSFDFNRADIKPAFRPTLDKLGDVIVKYDRTVVHVVGHTDSTGSRSYNADLSRRRAKSVSEYLLAGGVPDSRLRAEGRGEGEPRATNKTEAGRQLNRRVEIYVKPVVEGEEYRAYEPPEYLQASATR